MLSHSREAASYNRSMSHSVRGESGVPDRTSFVTPGAAFVVFLLVVWFAVFAPYASSYFFLFDDYAQLDFVSEHSYADILVTPEHGNFRPAAFLFWKTWLVLFGVGRPSAFSLFNLLAHSLNAILLALVLRRFRAPAVLAWSGAAVFLVFPPANEALFWMSGGHDTYGMTFLLLAVLAASMGPNAARAGPLPLAAMGVLSFAGTLAAMLSKETRTLRCPWSRHWHGSIATAVSRSVAACGLCGVWRSMRRWRPSSCCVVRSSRCLSPRTAIHGCSLPKRISSGTFSRICAHCSRSVTSGRPNGSPRCAGFRAGSPRPACRSASSIGDDVSALCGSR